MLIKKLHESPINDKKDVEKRLRLLEDKIKSKISDSFISVRKAFLELDSDYDGFITIENILKFFESESA